MEAETDTGRQPGHLRKKGGGERHLQTTGSSLKKWQQKTPDFRDGKLARQKQPLLCRIT